MKSLSDENGTMHMEDKYEYLLEENGRAVVSEIMKILSSSLNGVGNRFTVWYDQMRPWGYKSETFPLMKTEAKEGKQWILFIFLQETPDDTLKPLWWKSYRGVRKHPESCSCRVTRVTRRTLRLTRTEQRRCGG